MYEKDKPKETFKIVFDVPMELECVKGTLESTISGMISAMSSTHSIGFIQGGVDAILYEHSDGDSNG